MVPYGIVVLVNIVLGQQNITWIVSDMMWQSPEYNFTIFQCLIMFSFVKTKFL